MSIKIFTGKYQIDLSNALMRELREQYDCAPSHIVIVPDRYALYYEKLVMENIDSCATAKVDVLSLLRLSKLLAPVTKHRVLDKISSVMLLKRIMDENADKLRYFKKSAAHPGMVNEIYAVITNVRNSGILPNELQRITQSEDKLLAAKTHDIALLYNGYLNKLGDEFSDLGTRFDDLYKLIKSSEYIGKSNVYVCNFDSIYARERQAVCALMDNARNTYLGLLNSDGKNGRIYPNAYVDAYAAYAKKIGTECEVRHIEEKPCAIKAVAPYLFSYRRPQELIKCDGTYVNVYESVTHEARNTAAIIARLVRDGNIRYNQINVALGDRESYGKILESEFNKMGIPYHLDRKTPLGFLPLSLYMETLMELNAASVHVRSVIRLLLSPLSRFNAHDGYIFINFCYKYNISYINPRVPLPAGRYDKDYSAADGLRAAVYTLSGGADVGNLSAKDAAVQLITHMEKENLYGKVETMRLETEDGYEAEVNGQSYAAVKNILEQIGAIFGERKLPLPEFLSVYRTAAAARETAVIPYYIDAVNVGGADEAAYGKCKAAFILGADDNLPILPSTGGIMQERDLQRWSDYGVNVQPNFKEQYYAALMRIIQYLTLSEGNIYVSYSKVRAGGEQAGVSRLIDEISKIASVKEAETPDYTAYTANALEWSVMRTAIDGAAAPDRARIALPTMYRLLPEDAKDRVNERLCVKEKPEYIEGAAAGTLSGGVSAGKLERFLKCPFMYFMQYSLEIKGREKAKIQTVDMGGVLHAVMEKFFSGVPEAMSDCDIESRLRDNVTAVARLPEYAIFFKETDGETLKKEIFNRVVRSIKSYYSFMLAGRFRPFKTEVSFGMDGGDALVLRVNGREMKLRGYVDRIDEANGKYVIFDYKSSSVISFTRAQYCSGERIQLLTYAIAMKNVLNGDIIGAFYLPMPSKYVKSSDALKYQGLVSDKRADIDLLDEDFNIREKSWFLPFKKSKSDTDANVYKISDGRKFISADEAEVIKKDLEATVELIERGLVRAMPLGNACERCDYAQLCVRLNGEVIKR